MNWQEMSIREIKDCLTDTEVTAEVIEQLAVDSRKGVRELAGKYRRVLQYRKEREERWELLNQRECVLRESGYHYVAGIDEAGRGPLAGPVVAAAVILAPDVKIIGLDDSKNMSVRERERLFAQLEKKALAIGTGIVSNQVIDEINILQATFRAMREAVSNLTINPEYILVDGKQTIPDLEYEQEAIVEGDSRVNAIAAASIIAKVTRDRIIDEYHQIYPEYGFERNKGYGTKEHISALKEHGPTEIHRFSYSIVSKYHFLQHKRMLMSAGNESELIKTGEKIANSGRFSPENLERLRKIYREYYRTFTGSG